MWLGNKNMERKKKERKKERKKEEEEENYLKKERKKVTHVILSAYGLHKICQCSITLLFLL